VLPKEFFRLLIPTPGGHHVRTGGSPTAGVIPDGAASDRRSTDRSPAQGQASNGHAPDRDQDMRSPEFLEKRRKGPVMVLTVLPSGPPSMGSYLGLWFLYSAVVGLLAAYVAGRALPVGAPYLHVFRFVGATAFIGYSVALWQMSIWYRRAWLTTIKATVDGLIYALLTAGTFGWLWPR